MFESRQTSNEPELTKPEARWPGLNWNNVWSVCVSIHRAINSPAILSELKAALEGGPIYDRVLDLSTLVREFGRASQELTDVQLGKVTREDYYAVAIVHLFSQALVSLSDAQGELIVHMGDELGSIFDPKWARKAVVQDSLSKFHGALEDLSALARSLDFAFRTMTNTQSRLPVTTDSNGGGVG